MTNLLDRVAKLAKRPDYIRGSFVYNYLSGEVDCILHQFCVDPKYVPIKGSSKNSFEEALDNAIELLNCQSKLIDSHGKLHDKLPPSDVKCHVGGCRSTDLLGYRLDWQKLSSGYVLIGIKKI